MNIFYSNLIDNNSKKLEGIINIVLAGQSNAVGRVTRYNEDDLPADIPNTGYIENAYYFENDDTFKPYARRMNYNTDHDGEWSVEYRVAKLILDNNPKVTRVNLLKYGLGGQAVTGGCWGALSVCTNGLIDAYNLTGLDFDYMIWIQGESDSLKEAGANLYYTNAIRTFDNILSKTNSNMTLLLCTIAHNVIATPSLPYMYIVNQALSDIGRYKDYAEYVYIPEMTAAQIVYEQHYNNSGIEIIANAVYDKIIALI